MIRLNSVVVYCLWNELLRHPATGSKTCKMNEWTNHNKSSVQFKLTRLQPGKGIRIINNIFFYIYFINMKCTVRRAVHDYGLPHTAATSPKQSTTRDETVTQSLSLPRCQQHPLPSTAPNTMHSDALQYLLNDKYILIYVIIYCFIKIEMMKSEISLAELALIPIPAFLDPKNILSWDCCRGDKQAPRCGPSRAIGARKMSILEGEQVSANPISEIGSEQGRNNALVPVENVWISGFLNCYYSGKLLV